MLSALSRQMGQSAAEKISGYLFVCTYECARIQAGARTAEFIKRHIHKLCIVFLFIARAICPIISDGETRVGAKLSVSRLFIATVIARAAYQILI